MKGLPEFHDVFVNGAISKFGTIRILENTCRNGMPLYDYSSYQSGWESEDAYLSSPVIGHRPIEPDDGAEYYHPVFHQYADGKHRAEIVSNSFVIFDENGIGVTVILAKELKPVLLGETQCKVHPSGYVYAANFSKRSLDELLAGKPPRYCDNSVFAKVDPSLAGTDVIEFWFAGFGKEERAVFYPDGRAIPCTTGRPLAYKRWGRLEPPLKDPFSRE